MNTNAAWGQNEIGQFSEQISEKEYRFDGKYQFCVFDFNDLIGVLCLFIDLNPIDKRINDKDLSLNKHFSLNCSDHSSALVTFFVLRLFSST